MNLIKFSSITGLQIIILFVNLDEWIQLWSNLRELGSTISVTDETLKLRYFSKTDKKQYRGILDAIIGFKISVFSDTSIMLPLSTFEFLCYKFFILQHAVIWTFCVH